MTRIYSTEVLVAPAWLRAVMPTATELERFEMGDREPIQGVVTYKGGPEKGLKAHCYLSASSIELVALRPKRVTKGGGGVEVGSTVLKVAAHIPAPLIISFTSKDGFVANSGATQ